MYQSGRKEGAEDLVFDWITKHNNPNLKNLSSADLFGDDIQRETYIKTLNSREDELLDFQSQWMQIKAMKESNEFQWWSPGKNETSGSN